MEIIWTEKAIASLIETINFINDRFDMGVARNIRHMIEEQVDLLLINSFMGKVDQENSTDKFEFRFVIVNRKSKIFYFIEGEYIYIILVWDTRQSVQLLKQNLSSL